jgi:hypothetical protein
VFHFLVGPEERDLYRRMLGHALRSDAHAIVATFARLAAARAETHPTPRGMNQPFSWALMRRRPDGSSSSDTSTPRHSEDRITG